jgi:hypothetical protein
MTILNLNEMKGNWFVGDFLPTAFKTDKAEVCYKIHHKDEVITPHYHKIATEINLLVEGKMIINSETILAGQVFILHPNEVVFATPVEDSKLIVVKIPSIVGDKYEV